MATSSRAGLLKAARCVFLRHGYKATSIAGIAKRAGIAVGSVYALYPSKLELFQAVYETENTSSKQKIVAAINWSHPKPALQQYIRANIEAIRHNKILAEWYSQVPGEVLRRTHLETQSKLSGCFLGESLAKKVSEWRASGQLRPVATDQLLSELFTVLTIKDTSGKVSPEMMQFLIEAVLDKLFIDA